MDFMQSKFLVKSLPVFVYTVKSLFAINLVRAYAYWPERSFILCSYYCFIHIQLSVSCQLGQFFSLDNVRLKTLPPPSWSNSTPPT